MAKIRFSQYALLSDMVSEQILLCIYGPNQGNLRFSPYYFLQSTDLIKEFYDLVRTISCKVQT